METAGLQPPQIILCFLSLALQQKFKNIFTFIFNFFKSNQMFDKVCIQMLSQVKCIQNVRNQIKCQVYSNVRTQIKCLIKCLTRSYTV